MIFVLAGDFDQFVKYVNKTGVKGSKTFVYVSNHGVLDSYNFGPKLCKRSWRERIVARIRTGKWPEKFYDTEENVVVLTGTWYDRTDINTITSVLYSQGWTQDQEDEALGSWMRTLYK
jgi:hypothetical protein